MLVCSSGGFSLEVLPLSQVARRALTLAADVVTQAAVTTRALLRAVDPEGAERTRLCAHWTLEGQGRERKTKNKVSL